MKKFQPVLLIVVLVSAAACTGGEDEPAKVARFRLSWIHSEDFTEVFEYNTEGRVSGWSVTTAPGSSAYKATFAYDSDEKKIAVVAEEDLVTERRLFSENMIVDDNGLAVSSSGTFTLRNGERVEMTKNYTMTFHYNTSRQLVRVDVSEWRVDGNGQPEATSLDWTAALEWTGNNMTEYREYTNPEYPLVSKAYSYFDNISFHYSPIVQKAMLRSYYLPLQYQGVLGRLSDNPVRSMVSTTRGQSSVPETFTYKVSASSVNSFVEEYTRQRDGRSTVFTVGWDIF